MKWPERVFYFFLGAITWFFLPHLIKLNFKYEFDVADCFNLVVTLAVAYFVGAVLSRKYTNIRTERDILIRQAERLLDQINEARQLYLECFDTNQITRKNKQGILAIVRNIANELAFLQKSVSICSAKPGQKQIESARNFYSGYRTALTGGNFPGRPYSEQSRIQMEQNYRGMREKMHVFILEVNKS